MTVNQDLTIKELLAKDEEFLSSALYRIFHIVSERGEGSYIYTTDGIKYLDLTCGIGVTQLGHCHPEVIKRAKEQLDKLVHISCVTHHLENIKLGEKLSKILPGNLNNTFFCNSGAEAVDGVIKLSRYVYKGRPNIIAFRGSFHGRTLGATSLSSSKELHRKHYDPLLPCIHFVNFPKDEKSASESLDSLNKMFKLNLPPESVGTMIIEPVLGEGGYLPAPVNFLKELRTICDKHNIFFICDEVQSGIGRTGKWFAVEHYGIIPDAITIAKGIANGLPLGGFSANKKHMSLMPPGSHGSTFGGNPVSCAAALKTLEIIERDNLLDYVSKTGSELIKHLQNNLSGKATVRGFGFMIGIELKDKEICEKVINECFKEKMLLLTAGPEQKVIRFIPALNIDKNLLFNVVDKMVSIIKKY